MVESYEKTLEKAVQAFALFDGDGDGKITANEIESAMAALGQFVNQDEVKEIMGKLDRDQSGCIDFKEFLEYIRGGSHKRISKTALWAAFKANDEDNLGLIENFRVIEILHELGIDLSEQEKEDFIRILDPSSSGKSNYIAYENTTIELQWLF